MKKIPRITINRTELCKQLKSGAFRTAILTPFHRMSSVFGFGSPAAKNIQQIVYKLNESHYEVLKTTLFMLPNSFVTVVCNVWLGLHHPEKKTGIIFYRARKLQGCFSYFLKNQRQPDMYLLLKYTNLKNNKGLLFPLLCFCFGIEGGGDLGRRRRGAYQFESFRPAVSYLLDCADHLLVTAGLGY